MYCNLVFMVFFDDCRPVPIALRTERAPSRLPAGSSLQRGTRKGRRECSGAHRRAMVTDGMKAEQKKAVKNCVGFPACLRRFRDGNGAQRRSHARSSSRIRLRKRSTVEGGESPESGLSGGGSLRGFGQRRPSPARARSRSNKPRSLPAAVASLADFFVRRSANRREGGALPRPAGQYSSASMRVSTRTVWRGSDGSSLPWQRSSA